jgi:hypothetical protein
MMISATSVVVSLLLVEGALQVCDCTSEVAKVKIDRESLDQIDMILDQRSDGLEISPAFSAVALQHVASEKGSDLFLSHISNTQVVLSEEDDGLIIINTDENGFRNPRGLYDQSDTFDVFLVGDSFTEGWSVPDGFTIADHIRQTTSYTVYNGGLGGSGTLHSLAVLIEYGLPKEPNNVVLVIVESLSLGRALNELNFERLNSYYTDHQPSNLIAKRTMKDQILTAVIEAQLPEARKGIVDPPGKPFSDHAAEKINTTSRVVQLIKANSDFYEIFRIVGKEKLRVEGNRYQGEGVPNCGDLEERKEILHNILSWLDGRIDQYGGTLFVTYVPAVRYSGYVDWPECEHDLVIETTRELGVPLIDVIPVMNISDQPSEYYARHPADPNFMGHPNRKGYQVIADQIIERIKIIED